MWHWIVIGVLLVALIIMTYFALFKKKETYKKEKFTPVDFDDTSKALARTLFDRITKPIADGTDMTLIISQYATEEEKERLKDPILMAKTVSLLGMFLFGYNAALAEETGFRTIRFNLPREAEIDTEMVKKLYARLYDITDFNDQEILYITTFLRSASHGYWIRADETEPGEVSTMNWTDKPTGISETDDGIFNSPSGEGVVSLKDA